MSATNEVEPRKTLSIRDSVIWMGGLKIVTQLSMWVITFMTIRLLEPADYGMNALREVATSVVFVLISGSIAASVIQRSEVSEVERRNLCGYIMVLGAILFIGQWFLSAAFAAFYNESQLTDLVRVSSLAILLAGLYAVPHAELNKKRMFRELAFIDLTSSLLGGITTLGFAYLGHGVWSFVYGILVKVSTRTVLVLYWNNGIPIPSLSNPRSIASHMRYNSLLVLCSLIAIFYEKMDVIIISKYFDATQIGVYAVAMQLSVLTLSKTMPIFKQIAFPTYSQIKHKPKLAMQYFLKSIRIALTVLVPLLFGLGVTSEVWLPILIGHKWIDAAPLILLVCLSMPFRVVIELLNPLIKSTGAAGTLVIRDILSASVVAVCVFIAVTSYGLQGAAASWLLALPFILIATVAIIRTRIQVPVLALATSLAPPLVAGGLMVSTLLWAPLFSGYPPWATLALHVGVGASVYGVVMLCFGRGHILELLQFMRPSINKPQ